MKKTDYFKQTFNEFLQVQKMKWSSRGFKFHKGHLNLMKYAYLVKVRWLISFNKKMIASKNFLIEFKKFTNNLYRPQQLRLF